MKSPRNVLVRYAFAVGVVLLWGAAGAVDPSPTSSAIPEAPQADAIPDSARKWNGVVDAQVTEEFQKRRSDLNQREKAVSQQEAELKKREALLQEEMSKLSSLRSEIQGMNGDQKKKTDERVAKLVEAFEKMSPKAASELLIKMDSSLAVSAMNSLSTEKLAKILNVMDPVQSSQLSEMMAGLKRSTTPQTTNPKEGGERK